LTAHDVRTALNSMTGTHATRTIQKAHNCLTRAIRQAEGQDLVRRNVSSLVDTPPRSARATVPVADARPGQGTAEGRPAVPALRLHRAVPADWHPLGRGPRADLGPRGDLG